MEIVFYSIVAILTILLVGGAGAAAWIVHVKYPAKYFFKPPKEEVKVVKEKRRKRSDKKNKTLKKGK